MHEFKKILFSLVLFGLFAFLITYTAVEMGTNYGRSSTEIGNGALDNDEFYNSIETVSSSADNYRARFGESKIDDVDDATGIFTILTDMVSMITAPFKLLGVVMKNLLGIPTIVINIILGLISIGLILSIWGLIRIGH